MSIHPSLGSSGGDKKQRSVLKRTERLRTMLEKEQWKEGDKVYGLPKIKTIRIRIKKEKAEKVEGEGVTAEGAAPAAGAQAPGQGAAKTPSKGAAEKKEK
ncbi:MAG: small basic protein [Candidatus Omnitrophica bacterium]|nr:small basic protein [Candidatus Omnitrophota bacterium]